MSGTIKPLHDRLLVKRVATNQTTASGIIIPDTAQEKTFWGTVVSTGDGRIDQKGAVHPLTVKAGDQIIFGKYTGTEFTFEETEYVILREDDVLGVIQ